MPDKDNAKLSNIVRRIFTIKQIPYHCLWWYSTKDCREIIFLTMRNHGTRNSLACTFDKSGSRSLSLLGRIPLDICGGTFHLSVQYSTKSTLILLVDEEKVVLNKFLNYPCLCSWPLCLLCVYRHSARTQTFPQCRLTIFP